jgi:hypothetical protein
VQAKKDNLTVIELKNPNVRLAHIAGQIKAMDNEMRKIEDGKVLEWASMAGNSCDAHFVFVSYSYFIKLSSFFFAKGQSPVNYF